MGRFTPFAKTVALVALVSAAASTADAALITGLTEGHQLVTFNSAAPGTLLSAVGVTGVQPGEAILGIDYRPATNELYGLGSGSRLYKINPLTGVATQVGTTQFAPALSGVNYGFDFNPVADRVRVTSNSGQNFRLNPNDGSLTGADLALNPGSPYIVGSAYTNNFAGSTATSLYDIDSNTDSLYTQNPPNNGTLNLVGPLGFDTDGRVGFDIVSVGGPETAYASLVSPTGNTSGLYTINLATGAATLLGTVGGANSGVVLRDIAVPVPEPTALGLCLVCAPALLRRRRA